MENLVSFQENGQGVINFDALELVTSVDFVDRLKDLLSRGYFYVDLHFSNVGVIFVNVLLGTNGGVFRSITFWKYKTGSTEISETSFSLLDAERAIKWIENQF